DRKNDLNLTLRIILTASPIRFQMPNPSAADVWHVEQDAKWPPFPPPLDDANPCEYRRRNSYRNADQRMQSNIEAVDQQDQHNKVKRKQHGGNGDERLQIAHLEAK